MSDKLPSELTNMICDYLKPNLYIIVCYVYGNDDPIVIDVVDESQIQTWLDKLKCIEFKPFDENVNEAQEVPSGNFCLSNSAKFYYSTNETPEIYTYCSLHRYYENTWHRTEYAVIKKENNSICEIMQEFHSF